MREVTTLQPEPKFGDWKSMGEVAPKDNGELSLPYDPTKAGLLGDRAFLLQAGIRLQRKKGQPMDYPSSDYFVHYAGISGQAAAVLKPVDKPFGPEGVKLEVTLPEYYEHAYPGLLANMELKATSQVAGEQIPYSAKLLEPINAERKLIWQLRLDDETLRNKLNEARTKGAVPLDVALQRPAQADAPTLTTLHFALLPKAKPVSGLLCERQAANGNVLVTWTKPESSVTQYIVKRWQYTAPTEIEIIRSYAAGSLQETRFDIPAGELKTGTSYGLRVKAVNDYGEAEDSAAEVCNFDIPKPPEAKQ